MKKHLLLLVFCVSHSLFSQSEVTPSLALPIRNSLKWNRFLLHPTFSFVREQSPVITFYNKRQWVSFEDAPQTYLVSYSGRFRENEGIGIGLFQKNEGLFTSFGAVANFAHAIELQRDNHLTFGVNLGFYKNGLNTSKAVTNFIDPAFQTIPSSSFFVFNPGINYGTAFLDFGVSVNHFLVYNLRASELVVDDPDKSVSVHLMHTGYIEANGFFDKSKFSGLLRSEFRKDKIGISGLAMLTIPNGIWTQLGYNTIYGISAGLGLNISQSIAIEYNYERGLGNFTNFGASHEIGFAYKFSNNNLYFEEDELGSLIPPAAERSVEYSRPKKVEKPKEKTAPLVLKEPVQEKPIAVVTPSRETVDPPKQVVESSVTKDTIVTTSALAEAQPQKDTTKAIVPKPKDREFVAIDNLTAVLAVTKTKQDNLLNRLTVTIAQRENDLAQMKQENDLSEQGIYTEPKPFKSSALENSELELLQTEITAIAKEQKDKIRELENAYSEKMKKGNEQDEILLKEYAATIQNLKEEHLAAVQANADLNRSLEQIKEATEIEKKRRIKRASFVNVDGRLAQDIATLKRIKETTVLSTVPLKPSDFDSGEVQPEVQIIKGNKNVLPGYYVVIAVHNEVAKRDEFLTKTVASGEANVNFFYDANSSKYFIYYESFETIEAAKQALNKIGSAPYNGAMTIVKMEK
jgi:type IX secretion system PorP/SprF family membrane protein